MKFLVTGATGVLGPNLVRVLLAEGERSVRVLARQAGGKSLKGLDVESASGDGRDADAVRQAVEGCQAIIHSAAAVQLGWSKLAEHRQINVEGTRHVASAARESGARLVHISTVDTLGLGSRQQPAHEDSPRIGKIPCTYVVTKREAEQVVEEEIERGLEAVIVHPGFMLGPWDWKPSSGRMLLEIATRWTPIAPTGGCSAGDVRDVVAGVIAALRQAPRGRHYILAGHNVSYFDLWRQMATVAGAKGPRFRAGPLMRVIGGRFGDLRAKLTGREPDVNSAAVAMSSQWHYYSSARAGKELDYRVRPLEESLADAWEWFRANDYVREN
jgi:dihydroflavonol-4-reductase